MTARNGPAGTYTLTATGKDSSGNNVAISTEVQGIVDSVDLTASPPLLSIGGQTYTTDQIKRVVRPTQTSGRLLGTVNRCDLDANRSPWKSPARSNRKVASAQASIQTPRCRSHFCRISRRFVLEPWA